MNLDETDQREAMITDAVVNGIEPEPSSAAHTSRIEKDQIAHDDSGKTDPKRENKLLRNLLSDCTVRNQALCKIVDGYRAKENSDAAEQDKLYRETRRRNRELLREVAALSRTKARKPCQDDAQNDGLSTSKGTQYEALASNFRDVVEHQVLPYVPDYTDHWFTNEWTALYRRIFEWADSGYRFVPNHTLKGSELGRMFWEKARTCNDALFAI